LLPWLLENWPFFTVFIFLCPDPFCMTFPLYNS
jgi:hypothetical protein